MEEGFYWIDFGRAVAWQPAEFRDGQWFVLGSEETIPRRSLRAEQIGPRIEPPIGGGTNGKV